MNNPASRRSATPISGWQVYVLVSMSALLGFPLSYGRLNDTWFTSQIILSAVIFLAVLLMVAAFKNGGYSGVYDALSSTLGDTVSRFIFIFMGIYFIFQAANSVGVQGEMIDLFLLESTPADVEIIVLVLCAALPFFYGLRQIAQTAAMAVWVVILPIAPLLILGVKSIDFAELSSVFHPKASEMPVSLLSGTMSLWGVESLLFFLGRDKIKPKSAKLIFFALLTDILITIFAFFIIVGTFTMNGANGTSFPLNEFSRMVNVGGTSTTMRFDILFIIVRMVSIIIGVSIAMYCSAISFCSGFKIARFRVFCFLIIPAVFMLAFWGGRYAFASLIDRVCRYGFLFIILVLVPVVFAVSLIKGERGTKK